MQSPGGRHRQVFVRCIVAFVAGAAVLFAIGACRVASDNAVDEPFPDDVLSTAAPTASPEPGVDESVDATPGADATDASPAPTELPTTPPIPTPTPTPTPLPAPELSVEVAEFSPFGYAEAAGLTGGLGQELYTVTSKASGGDGTLRNALRRGDRYIRFAPELDGETIELNSTIETNVDNVTIDGSGMSITISGDGIKFSGTNIVVAGLHFRDNTRESELTDALTFRDAARTQLIGLYGNSFETAADGLIDFIWNRGNDVHVTACGNSFRNHDKAMLIHGGRNSREGGVYRVTLCRNHWYDIFQRTPLSRDARVHQFNSVFEAYGKPNGDGGAVAVGEGAFATHHLLESSVFVPRLAGTQAWDGETVTEPRSVAVNVRAAEDAVRVEDLWLVAPADVETRQPDQVEAPPYRSQVTPVSEGVRASVTHFAGTCFPVDDVDAVNPCRFAEFGTASQPILVQAAGVHEVVARIGDRELAVERVRDEEWQIDAPGEPGILVVEGLVDGEAVVSEAVPVATL